MSDWWKSKQPWLHVNANIDHTLVRPGAKRLWQLRQSGVGFNIPIQHTPKTEPISLWKSSMTFFLAWTFAISSCVFSSPPTPPLQPWCVFAFRKHTIVPKLTFTEMALIWSSSENLNQCSEANNNFSPKIIHRWELSPVPPEVNIDKLYIDDFESENTVFWLHFL